MKTKDGLTERTRGKGGTVVRQTGGPNKDSLRAGETLIVKDLFQRVRYNRPDSVGVGPAERGIAWAVKLSDIEIVA